METNELNPNPNHQIPDSQQASNVSFETQGEKSNNGLVIGLIIFSLFALGIAGVFAYQNYQLKKQIGKPSLGSEVAPTKTLQSTPSSTSTIAPTADWQIYKGDGFELSYPRDWYLLETPGPVTRFSNSETDGEGSLVVSVFKNTDVNMDSLDSRKKYYENEPEKFVILGDITVDGKPGFEVEFLDRFQREAIIAGDYNEVPQNVFTVFVTYPGPQKNEAIDEYLKILSTFKFTN
jgi:hypothetical protein